MALEALCSEIHQPTLMLSQLGYGVKIKTQNTEHEKYLAHEEYCQQVIHSKLI